MGQSSAAGAQQPLGHRLRTVCLQTDPSPASSQTGEKKYTTVNAVAVIVNQIKKQSCASFSFTLSFPHVPSQAEEFRTAVQMLLEWLSEAEQTLRFRGILPEEVETLQALLHTHRNFMQTVEEKRVDVNKAAGMGEAILAVCHPDCITTIKHWITIIRARFEEVVQL